MDFQDNVFDVGVPFVNADDSSYNAKPKLPANDLLIDDTDHSIPQKEYTKDGRDRNRPSIVVKPYENDGYANPDPTGNGVDTVAENLLSNERLDDSTEFSTRIWAAKERIKTLVYNLQSMRTQFNRLNHIFTADPRKIESARKIYKQMVFFETVTTNSDRYLCDTSVNFRYFKREILLEIYAKFFKDLMSIDYLKLGSLSDYIDRFKHIDKSRIMTSSGMQYVNRNEELTLCEATGGDWENIVNIIKGTHDISEFLNKTDFTKWADASADIIKKNYEIYNSVEYANLIGDLGHYMYEASNEYLDVTTDICDGILAISKLFFPKDNIKIVVDNKTIGSRLEELDPWVGTDYHLLAELIKTGGANFEHTDAIVAMHNKHVRGEQYFLFLGDLSESEIFDQNHMEAARTLIQYVKALNGRKIIIKGNNDTCSNEFLKKCGFLEVYDNPILLEHVLISHGPVKTAPGIINLHGHIHGSKNYWNIDYRDHIDAWHGLWGGMNKLSFYLSNRAMHEYLPGCKTVLNKPIDPETQKRPGNLIS